MTSYPDRTFRPNDEVSPVDYAEAIARAFSLPKLEDRISVPEDDNLSKKPGYPSIQKAYQMGFIPEISEKLFDNQQKLSCAEVLACMMDGLRNEPSLKETFKYWDFGFSRLENSFFSKDSIDERTRGIVTDWDKIETLTPAETWLIKSDLIIKKKVIIMFSEINIRIMISDRKYPGWGPIIDLMRKVTRAELAGMIYLALSSIGKTPKDAGIISNYLKPYIIYDTRVGWGG